MKFYESKYGKKVDETTGKQIEIDTGSNNKQAGVDANRVKDNIDASGKARESSNFREHVVNEKGLENAGKGTTSTESKVGEYLEDFKPSPTPTELVQQQAGKDTQVTINTDHILNGEIKTYKSGKKVGTGGHYLKDPKIKVDKWTGEADANGVTKGFISVRDPATGKWYEKPYETTFFPKHWSKRQTEKEIKSAFENSKPDPNYEDRWIGILPALSPAI